jgi:phosphate transport system protein
MEEKTHTSIHYEKELQDIKEQLLYEGALVEQAIERAVRSLLERNSDLARAVIADDNQINDLDEKIEGACIRLLALRQPAAKDLRFIATTIKVNGHLERIGDLAVNIAKRAADLNEVPPVKPYIDLPRMADITREMVRESLDALVNEDCDLAHAVREKDEVVDNLNEQIFRELLTFMMEDPKTIHRALLITQISKNLERISDHAESVAKMVIYMVTGKSVRHRDPGEGL